MAQKKHNRIQKFSGVYKCAHCKKETRETGLDESSVGLCAKCYTICNYDNMLNDGEITLEQYNEAETALNNGESPKKWYDKL